MIIVLLGLLAVVSAGSSSDNKDSYKNQFRSDHSRKHKGKHDVTSFSTENCTDPRTMKKHPAYTEWADAYSCTRHRCQPGGRNLAIYTVGCKRVEAPESAIECEEVVEDTNMQFPFCCTRLRCLVVVRGEVWTRVLGQPWEVLPAAPWSHMYKMKKPPPGDSTFVSKPVDQGPIYELTDNDSGSEGGHDKVLLRTGKNTGSLSGDQPELRNALPSPDIVIALSTNNEGRESSPSQKPETSRSAKHSKSRHSQRRLQQPPAQYFEEEVEKEKQAEQVNPEIEEVPASTEKPPEDERKGKENEKEKFFGNNYYSVTQKPSHKTHRRDPPEDEGKGKENEKEKFFGNNYYPVTQNPSHKSHRRDITHSPMVWTGTPTGQWNEPKEGDNLVEPRRNEHYNNNNNNEEPQLPLQREPKLEALQKPAKKETADARDTKPNNLQALVDAIGSRMRDIESVVQKMSNKVQQVKATTEGSAEKRLSAERDGSHKQHSYKEYKRPSAEDENYKRFSLQRGTKYLHRSTETATEKPLFIGDFNAKGYFSDASNSILRRSPPKAPKEPPPTYMAPVAEKHRKAVQIEISEPSDDSDKKHKKHAHKKRRTKGAHVHKKRSRSKEDRRKHFNKLSAEAEENAVSVDESSDLVQ